MKYSNGFVELNDSEVEILEFFKLDVTERSYPASTFVGILAEVKREAQVHMHSYKTGEQTNRTTLQIEMIQMLIDTCDRFLEELDELTEGNSLGTYLN